MYGEGASLYDRQKQEAKRVLSKIKNKHYQEIQLERKEGLSIVDDLKDQLRRNFKRTRTQKLNKRIRQREMTYQFRKSLIEAKSKEDERNNSEIRRQSGRKSIMLSQNSYLPSTSRASRRLSTINKTHLSDVLKQIASELKPDQQEINQQQNSQNQSFQESQINKPSPRRSPLISLNYSECKSFLPMLDLYIQQRLFLRTMTSNQKKIQSMITQMLLLALARGKNNKLLDALDILVDIQKYFPKKSVYMKQLKACWYLAIGKLFLHLKQDEKQRLKVNRWQRQARRISSMSLLSSRRQKTIIIRSIASKRNFMNRIFIQMKKMDLVLETTYQQQLRKEGNFIQQNQSGKVVISKINKTHVMAFPEPFALFGSSQVLNYSIIVVQRDKQSNLFPNLYLNSLLQIIPKNQYTMTMCKINSILLPESRCFNYQTSLYCHYEPIFCIFLVFLVAVVLGIYLLKRTLTYGFMITLIVSLAVVLCLSLRIHGHNNQNIGKKNEIYSKINRILQQWCDQYQNTNLKYSLSQNADVLILSFPLQEQQIQLFSSQKMSSQNSIARQSRRFSLSSHGFTIQTGETIGFKRFDQVIERDLSSDNQLQGDQSESQSQKQLAKDFIYIEQEQRDNSILQNHREKQQIQRLKQKNLTQLIFKDHNPA